MCIYLKVLIGSGVNSKLKATKQTHEKPLYMFLKNVNHSRPFTVVFIIKNMHTV